MEHTESEPATVSGEGHESLRDSPPPPDYYEATERNPQRYLPPQDFQDTQTPNSPQTTFFPLHGIHQNHPPQPQYQPPQEAAQFSTSSETGTNRSSRPQPDRLQRAIETEARLNHRYERLHGPTAILAIVMLILCASIFVILIPFQAIAVGFSDNIKAANSPAKKKRSAIISITCSITTFVLGCLFTCVIVGASVSQSI